MSAFMCTDEHLSYLAVEAVRRDRHGSCGGLGYHSLGPVKIVAQEHGVDWDCATQTERAKVVFGILARENARSLEARYSDRSADMIGECRFMQVEHQPRPNPVSVLKSIACYEYQACEHDAWPDSLAFKIMRSLEDATIRRLPGFDDAPWGAPVAIITPRK